MVQIACAKHASAGAVVAQCRTQLGPVRPQLLLVFCGGKHDPEAILTALRASFGANVPVVGGSAAGVIWRDGLGYSGLELGIAAFAPDDAVPRIVVAGDLLSDERAAGRNLGARIAAVAADDAVVLLLYDSVATTTPLRLHPASDLVAGITDGLGGKPVCLLGGGLLTDMNLSDGWVFHDDAVAKHMAAALVFPAAVVEETEILHGCRPVSTFMEITRVDGAEVFELDGEPALEVIERMLGLPIEGTVARDLSLIATLGEKQGDPFAPYDENAYVNRLILGADRATGAITLFEPDFRQGTRVQIMSRDNGLMLESVTNGVATINRAVQGRDCMLAIYIDCAGRGSARSGAVIEEADLVRRDLDPAIPLLGFYSGVEIAPFVGYSRPLDWTGVLTVLCRRRG